MATYHGLVQVSCVVCSWLSNDESQIEVLNDMGGSCPVCENEFFIWRNEDGSIVVSLTQDIDGLHTYDNLVYKEEK